MDKDQDIEMTDAFLNKQIQSAIDLHKKFMHEIGVFVTTNEVPLSYSLMNINTALAMTIIGIQKSFGVPDVSIISESVDRLTRQFAKENIEPTNHAVYVKGKHVSVTEPETLQ